MIIRERARENNITGKFTKGEISLDDRNGYLYCVNEYPFRKKE